MEKYKILLEVYNMRLEDELRDNIKYRKKHKSELEKNKYIQKEIIMQWVKVLELYDIYTKGHSENVQKIQYSIGEQLNLKNEELIELYFQGLLHDIGKIFVPKHILNKKGKLIDKEFQIIKKHSYYGYLFIKSFNHLHKIQEQVKYHHKYYSDNYRSYPNDDIFGDDIPLFSRILILQDSLDVMIHSRPYRKQLSKKEWEKELERNRNIQFDGKIIDQFYKSKFYQSNYDFSKINIEFF